MPKRRKTSKIPPGPTGDEPLDLAWAGLTRRAELLMSLLPADPVWATPECALRYATTVLRYDELVAQLTRAPGGRVVARARQRRVALLHASKMLQALFICAALTAEARAQHPKATFGQVWFVVRDRVKQLVRAAAEASLDLTEAERDELLAASALA